MPWCHPSSFACTHFIRTHAHTLTPPPPPSPFPSVDFAAPLGMNGATLVSKLETSIDDLKAKGGFPDFVRDFDVDTGKTGNFISVCGLGGEQYPEGVALKCGGQECILLTTRAAAYTGLSLNISGAGKR